MKNAKKFVSIVTALTLVVVMLCSQPIQAHAAAVGNDMYAQRATEEVVIDGVTYTFNYFYEDGNRAITIENSENSRLEKVTYDPRTATMSYYEGATESKLNATSGDWVLWGSSSHKVAWDEGVGVAVAAAIIAGVLGFCGVAAVITAMGEALAIVAASSVGGTVYITTYYMTVPYQGTQYLYVWSFTASTGDSYGPYQYLDVPVVS